MIPGSKGKKRKKDTGQGIRPWGGRSLSLHRNNKKESEARVILEQREGTI